MGDVGEQGRVEPPAPLQQVVVQAAVGNLNREVRVDAEGNLAPGDEAKLMFSMVSDTYAASPGSFIDYGNLAPPPQQKPQVKQKRRRDPGTGGPGGGSLDHHATPYRMILALRNSKSGSHPQQPQHSQPSQHQRSRAKRRQQQHVDKAAWNDKQYEDDSLDTSWEMLRDQLSERMRTLSVEYKQAQTEMQHGRDATTELCRNVAAEYLRPVVYTYERRRTRPAFQHWRRTMQAEVEAEQAEERAAKAEAEAAEELQRMAAEAEAQAREQLNLQQLQDEQAEEEQEQDQGPQELGLQDTAESSVHSATDSVAPESGVEDPDAPGTAEAIRLEPDAAAGHIQRCWRGARARSRVSRVMRLILMDWLREIGNGHISRAAQVADADPAIMQSCIRAAWSPKQPMRAQWSPSRMFRRVHALRPILLSLRTARAMAKNEYSMRQQERSLMVVADKESHAHRRAIAASGKKTKKQLELQERQRREKIEDIRRAQRKATLNMIARIELEQADSLREQVNMQAEDNRSRTVHEHTVRREMLRMARERELMEQEDHLSMRREELVRGAEQRLLRAEMERLCIARIKKTELPPASTTAATDPCPLLASVFGPLEALHDPQHAEQRYVAQLGVGCGILSSAAHAGVCHSASSLGFELVCGATPATREDDQHDAAAPPTPPENRAMRRVEQAPLLADTQGAIRPWNARVFEHWTQLRRMPSVFETTCCSPAGREYVARVRIRPSHGALECAEQVRSLLSARQERMLKSRDAADSSGSVLYLTHHLDQARRYLRKTRFVTRGQRQKAAREVQDTEARLANARDANRGAEAALREALERELERFSVCFSVEWTGECWHSARASDTGPGSEDGEEHARESDNEGVDERKHNVDDSQEGKEAVEEEKDSSKQHATQALGAPAWLREALRWMERHEVAFRRKNTPRYVWILQHLQWLGLGRHDTMAESTLVPEGFSPCYTVALRHTSAVDMLCTLRAAVELDVTLSRDQQVERHAEHPTKQLSASENPGTPPENEEAPTEHVVGTVQTLGAAHFAALGSANVALFSAESAFARALQGITLAEPAVLGATLPPHTKSGWAASPVAFATVPFPTSDSVARTPLHDQGESDGEVLSSDVRWLESVVRGSSLCGMLDFPGIASASAYPPTGVVTARPDVAFNASPYLAMRSLVETQRVQYVQHALGAVLRPGHRWVNPAGADSVGIAGSPSVVLLTRGSGQPGIVLVRDVGDDAQPVRLLTAMSTAWLLDDRCRSVFAPSLEPAPGPISGPKPDNAEPDLIEAERIVEAWARAYVAHIGRG